MTRLNNDQRNQAIGMLNAGTSATVISQHFGCTRKTIERLRRRFRVTGNVADRPRSGRPRVTTAVEDKICLIVINGNINAQTYINNVLAVEALPFVLFLGPNVTFMHNNALPHSAAITRQFLATNNVNVLDWPGNSPDLNPIEQVLEELRRRV